MRPSRTRIVSMSPYPAFSTPRPPPFPGLLRAFSRSYGQLDLLRPFGERSVVHPNAGEAEQVVQREVHMARFEPAVAVDDDGLVRRDPLGGIARPQVVERFPHGREIHLGEIALPEM